MGIKFNHVVLALLSTTAANTVFANQSPIDVKREEIVIFARQGDSQLEQAITQMSALYKKTQDQKVRDDLIALMVRKGQFKEATQVCSRCNVNSFSESELENLAKAYRTSQNLPKSLQLYEKLRSSYSQNPNGLLGSALVETELGKYQDAQIHLAQYKQKFGADGGYKDASSFLLDQTEPELAKLGRWQEQIKANPSNHKLAIQLYRLATKLNVHPVQDQLVQIYPELFTAKDKAWLEHSKVISAVKGNSSLKKVELQNAHKRLTHVIENIDTENPLYQQAIQDRLAVANRLNNNELVREDYQRLIALNKGIPDYVKEAYADTLLREGSAFKALDIYQELEAKERAQHKVVSTALLFKLISASSDAGYFQQAQDYQDQIRESETIWDFTRTTRLSNSNYERAYYNQVNLYNWRGDKSTAIEKLVDRLMHRVPGDPWTMLALSDLESSRNNHDRANFLADKASHFLGEGEQGAYKNQRANIAFSQGNLREVRKLIDGYTEEEREGAESVLKNYEDARRGSFTASFGVQRQTAPKNKSSNETTQEYYLNSPKSADGHYAYVHYAEEKVPTEDTVLKQRRIGVGTYVNLYPVNVNIEAGKGIKLHDKSYLSLATSYQFNQRWRFELSGNLNGSGTPIKAINQGVYTKDIGFTTTYTYRDLFRVGAGINVMKFDDGNLRKSFYAWASAETFRKDRWTLTNNLRFDYQRNKETASAWYYNPLKSRNIEFGADLSYWQPMNYGLALTHHTRASVGQYKQQGHKAERSWSLSYGHDWRITKKVSLSYEIGRKKNIYDGDAEFNNYGNINLSYSF
ncbi:poly-beta-1,6 N-acetyl-D-glucosamine export porin PgaA [Actinobacillus capsulatus]|uniref:poly-beta-1,6 N-acetyl-D-glucosamine export porin PgaA n=1 Tax=Actinobacillus capsulatus TaxID=717 RepID=UPI000365FE85|nr:poly-beta-1,6 N-acetyl-D-glucosamine export porin PgaA [Actinobacillus capsulatus]